MNLRLPAFLLLMLVFRLPAIADIAEDDNRSWVHIQVQLMNAPDYPGYKFYFKEEHWSDSFEEESVLDSVTKSYLVPGKPLQVSQSGDRLHLFAEDLQGNVYETDTFLGGMQVVYDEDYQILIHQFRVVSISNGVIKIKTVAFVEKDQEGNVLQVRKGALSARNPWGILAIPLASMLGLIAFFLLRRRVAGNRTAR